MHKSFRVGDYFENDDNGLWSWYLTSIRNGDFEELTGNQLKHSLLKRFLRTHLDPAFDARQDAKILIVSIAEDVRRDIKLLEYFLYDYFHLDNMDITKLTSSRTYNHENHYMVMDEKHNFENSDFLHFASSNIQAVHRSTGDELAATRVTDQIPKNPSLSESIGTEEDTASESKSMVFNFAHHDHQLNNQTHAGGFGEENLIREQVKSKQQGYNTSNDEIISIDSYNPESSSARVVESFKGEPLTLTMTRTEDFSSLEGYNSMNTSTSSTNTSLSSLEDCSLMSILPSISVADSFGHFRLVLQSVLFLNPTNNEIFTAIRQSNNKPTIADVNDDWLLYDSQFSMHNLQILTLQDLSELNKECPKILFYSLVEIFDTPSLERTEAECNTIFHKASSASLSRAPTKSSVSREPEMYSPIDKTSNGFRSGRMAKLNTNYSTVGHRSITTTNSAGDGIRQSLDSYGTGGPIRWHKSAIGTYKGSDGIMKRIRSTPLPSALKTIGVGDKHHKRWRDKFKLCRSNRLSRRPSDDRGCIIC